MSERERKRERESKKDRKREIVTVYSCFERREPGSNMSLLWGL